MEPVICPQCGQELQIGSYPFCTKDGDHKPGKYSVIQDSIEGGVLIEHGLCNPDGSPKRYYSKSEIAAEAKRRGLINLVRHVGEKGSDKNPNTTRWY
jgi:hypothetical protein